jgi:hypothetical protein
MGSPQPAAQARHHIWALWAAAHGALYPFTACHRCSTTTRGTCRWASSSPSPGLDAADLRRPRASTGILAAVSASAARRHPADLLAAMAAYVIRALSREP